MDRENVTNGQRSVPPAEAAGAAEAEAEFFALLRQAALHAWALFGKAGEFASLGWKRLKLRAVDGIFDAVVVVAACAAGLTIVVAASLLVVNGVHHAITRWAGADWVGELGGGLLALALPFTALGVVRWKTRRTLLANALRRPVAKRAARAAPAAPAAPVAPAAPAAAAPRATP
jgi:hypothetical protein